MLSYCFFFVYSYYNHPCFCFSGPNFKEYYRDEFYVTDDVKKRGGAKNIELRFELFHPGLRNEVLNFGIKVNFFALI